MSTNPSSLAASSPPGSNPSARSAGLPFVLPGSVGYLAGGPVDYSGVKVPAGLTPYSPPASGFPGAGNAPPACTWGAGPTFGLSCSVSNMILDHVAIYGSINFTGKTLTVTNSVFLGGTGTEFYCIWHNGVGAASGGVVQVSDCTLGWLSSKVYPAADNVATIRDTNSPFYEVVRCDLSGTPQGLNPGTGLVASNWIHGLFDPNPGVTHLDGIFMQGGSNIAIHGNYIDCPFTSDTTAAIFLQTVSGPIPGVVVTNNFLRGGSITFHNENGTGMLVANNTFGGGVNGDAVNIGADGGTINAWYNNNSTTTGPVPNPFTPVVTMAVTATEGGSASNGIAMQVVVLTGAAAPASQPGQTAGATQTTPSLAITPLTSGAFVYGSQLGLTGTYTALGNTTTKQNVNVAALEELSYRLTATTTASSPVTVGYTATANSISQVLAEIKASGTIAEDASTPAGVSTGAAATIATASFNPPVNSVLVAMIQSNGGAAATTMAVTDSSGLGLTWTELVKQNVAGDGYSGIWITQVIIP